MRHVLKINKLFFYFFICIKIFSCKYFDTNEKKVLNKKDAYNPLVFDANFNTFGRIVIDYDSLNWSNINFDSSFFVTLKSKKYLDSLIYFKTTLIASQIPFLFTFTKESNEKITFLIIQQHNTIHFDSIVLTKKSQHNYIVSKAYHVIEAKNGTHEIIPIIIKNIHDTFDLTKLDYRNQVQINR